MFRKERLILYNGFNLLSIANFEILQKKTVAIYHTAYYNKQATGRCVGIGRRGGLKIRWANTRAGSTPATGTRKKASHGDAFFNDIRSFRNG